MSSEIVGFSHVAIMVDDLAAAERFYGDILGLPRAQRPAWRSPGAWYRTGAVQLHIAVKPSVTPSPDPVYPHFALSVPSADYHATIERLRRAGVHFHVEPHQDAADGQWRAFCKDPAGNTVEITDHFPPA